METVRDFNFLGSKITADGNCSHEIKMLAPWRVASHHVQPLSLVGTPETLSIPGIPYGHFQKVENLVAVIHKFTKNQA